MFVRTERLLLRPGWVEDAPALTDAYARDDSATTPGNATWPFLVSNTVNPPANARPDTADLYIFLRTVGAPSLIGRINLAKNDGDMELHYWIVPSHRGFGFATEAGRAVVAMARDTLRLDRLVSGIGIESPASERVLGKLGFTRTGSKFTLALGPPPLALAA